jgi:hypothetical protein
MTNFINDLNFLGNIYISGRGFVPEVNTDEKLIRTLDDEDETMYDYLECIEKSKKTVNFNTVIIKYTDNTWYGKPIEWYNNDNYIKKIENYDYALAYKKLYEKYKILDKINSKKYIEIIKPFMEIHLHSDIKKEKLTLDDILFATRGLCVDETRTINTYKILKQTEDILILEPEIDNFSS